MGLFVLMVLRASKVGHLLDELSNKYILAYGHLARANIRSLERSLALRRMVIMKMQNPPDEAGYAERLHIYQQTQHQVEQEAEEARKLIASIIDEVSTPSDNVALTRIDTNIDNAVNELDRHLSEENAQLLSQLESKDFAEARHTLARADQARDEFSQKLDQIRADMLNQVGVSASVVLRNQNHAILITIVVTALAAALGLVFAILVSGGITRRSGCSWKAPARLKRVTLSDRSKSSRTTKLANSRLRSIAWSSSCATRSASAKHSAGTSIRAWWKGCSISRNWRRPRASGAS